MDILYAEAGPVPTPLPGGIEGATLEGVDLYFFNGQPEIRLAFEEGPVILLLPRGIVIRSFSIRGALGKVLSTALLWSADFPGFTLRVTLNAGEFELACEVPEGDPQVGLWFLE